MIIKKIKRAKKRIAYTDMRINQCDCGEVVISDYIWGRLKGLRKNQLFRMDFNCCRCGFLWILNGSFGVKKIK